MQVKIIACASFNVFRPTLICSGPNMSIAMLLNAGNPTATLNLRSWPISCSNGFLLSFLQVTHFVVRCFCGKVTYAYDPKTSSGFVNEAFAAAVSSFLMKVVEKMNKSTSFRENNWVA